MQTQIGTAIITRRRHQSQSFSRQCGKEALLAAAQAANERWHQSCWYTESQQTLINSFRFLEKGHCPRPSASTHVHSRCTSKQLRTSRARVKPMSRPESAWTKSLISESVVTNLLAGRPMFTRKSPPAPEIIIESEEPRFPSYYLEHNDINNRLIHSSIHHISNTRTLVCGRSVLLPSFTFESLLLCLIRPQPLKHSVSTSFTASGRNKNKYLDRNLLRNLWKWTTPTKTPKTQHPANPRCTKPIS